MPDISILNKGQTDAYNALVDFAQSKTDAMFILKGYAGTGKTFLIKKFLEWIKETRGPNENIAATAPTNKAVKVLMRSAAMPGVEYMTIHKLLGLTENITKEGEQEFIRKSGDNPSIMHYKWLVIDEVSMLNDELFVEVANYRNKVKIIFMGDPAQIPPVAKENCIPFDDGSEARQRYNFREYSLTEIMRQKGDNPIVALSFSIRENLENPGHMFEFKDQMNAAGVGIVCVNSTTWEGKDKVRELMNKYFNSPQFKEDADYAKVIGWRNKTITQVNDMIRGMIFGHVIPKIVKGEKLIANKPIFDFMENIIFNTSDEFEVTEAEVKSESVHHKTRSSTFKYYRLTVKAWNPKEGNYTTKINVLHEDSENDFNLALKELRDIALETRSKFDWKEYYTLMQHYADVNYNYSITAHKSQGSTYKNVFILDDDISLNPKVRERNRIKYTACSRPTDRLFMVARK